MQQHQGKSAERNIELVIGKIKMRRVADHCRRLSQPEALQILSQKLNHLWREINADDAPTSTDS